MAETPTAPVAGADHPHTDPGTVRSGTVPRGPLGLLHGDAGRPALLGALGSVLVTVASPGAGALRVRDPFLDGLGLSWLRYGHGQQLSMVVLYVGVALLVLAWVRFGRLVLGGGASVPTLRAAVALWTLPLLVASPVYSRDVFSYLAQGALLRDGFDPYQVGPVANPGPLLDNVSSVWTTTPAPYGPVFLLLARGITTLTGDSVVQGTALVRLSMLPGLVLLVWALPRLARHLHGRAEVALWLAALNPLVLLHLVGGAHNEMLMVGLMAAGVALALDSRHVGAVVVVTLAVGVKASAGIALPFVVWIWVAHLRERSPDRPTSEPVLLVRTAALGGAVFAAVFAAVTVLTGVGVGWLGALSGSNKIINWLSVPTAVAQLVGPTTSWFTGAGSDVLLPPLRLASGALLVVVLVALWWRHRHRPADAVRGLALALVAVVVLSPAALPWYYSWPLAFLAPLPWSRRGLAVAAGASTWLLLVFHPDGNIGLYNPGSLLLVSALATLAAVSVLRVDPLRLRPRAGRDAAGDPVVTP